MKTDEYYMKQALLCAEVSSSQLLLPEGAIVVSDDKVIGQGYRTKNKLGHPVISALMEVSERSYRLSGHELIVYATLEPCIMCFGATMLSGVDKIVYAMENPLDGISNFLQLQSVKRLIGIPDVVRGPLREESRRFLGVFFRVTQDPLWCNPENPLVEACRQ